MTKHGELDNPTLDVSEFKKGDYAEWLLHDSKRSFGVVADIIGDSVNIIHFEDGFGFRVNKSPKYGGIRKATKNEALTYFHSLTDEFEKEISRGDLSGAIFSRRQHHLNGIIANLEAKAINPYSAILRGVKEPETGLYVLMGIYSGQGPSEHLEGLVAIPRLKEADLSKIIIKIKPDGFGNIPSDVYNTDATSHGSLVAYWSYEIPKKARDLFQTQYILEDLGDKWNFIETIAKRARK